MLIIVPKCISNYSIQVILNDVHYHKYHHHHHWQISRNSVTLATRRHDLNCASLKSEWRPIFSGERSFFTLRVQVVLESPIGLFHPAAVSSLPPAKLSDNHPVGETLARWPNKYNCFKWVMSSDKKKTLAWNCSPFLNYVPFFKNAPKFQLRNMYFQQQQ